MDSVKVAADDPPDTLPPGTLRPPADPEHELTDTQKAPLSVLPKELIDRHRACLIVLTGPDVGRVFPVDRAQITIGRVPGAEVRLNDANISRRHARILMNGDVVTIEDMNSSNGTAVNGDLVRRTRLRDGDKIVLGPSTVLKFTYHDALDDRFQRNMLDAAQRDPLTGAYNARYFKRWLESEFALAQKQGSELALLIFDIDHFKRVNDTHGHLAGDTVLTEISRLVVRTLRTEDVFARCGGEEFAIVCRGQSLHGAITLAERLRRIIVTHAVRIDQTELHVSVSTGVACLTGDMTEAEQLFAAADNALYRAKHLGRNRVIAADAAAIPLPKASR
jgi:diguanylate cyclase (GGDEF)-like protein